MSETTPGPTALEHEGPIVAPVSATEMARPQPNDLERSLRELRAREEGLRRTLDELYDFVDNAGVALHRLAPDGTILWANRADLELLGHAEEEYLTRPIADFHVDRAVAEDILARLARGEAVHDREARLRARDGSIRHVGISATGCWRDGALVHGRVVTRDITERRLAEEALRASARQLQLITDALPVLVSYIDADRRYLFVNFAYERWFGHSKEQVVGQHMEAVLGKDAYRAIRPHVDRALAGTSVTFEVEVPYRYGGTRFIEATYIPHLGDDGRVAGFVALVADISERKAFDRFRAAAVDRAERLLKVTAAIANAVSSAQVFEAVVDHVADAVQASSAALWLVDEGGETATLVRARGYTEAAQARFHSLSLDGGPPTPALDALRERQPLWISSQQQLVARYPHLANAVTPGRSYRVSCLPIMASDRVLGVIGLTIEEARETGPDERDFLLLVARYASQAVARLDLLAAERRSRAQADDAAVRLGVLSRASRVFVEADLDLEARVHDVVTEMGRALDSAVGLLLQQPDGQLQVSASATYHPDPEAQEVLRALAGQVRVGVGEGVTGNVAASGQSLLVPSLDPGELVARAAPGYRPFVERFPAYALICVPLRARGQIIGTVLVARVRPGERYTSDDLRLVEELAERAAMAIENSRLYQQARDARARAEQLYRFAQAAVGADRVEQVYQAALTAIEASLGTDRAAILILDGDQVMRFKAWRNLSDEYRRAVEGHSPWAPDVVAPEPVLVPDPAADPALAPLLPVLRAEGIGAMAFIPLVSGGRLIGKFMVYHARPHLFAAHELETARAIANHLASVISRFAAVAKLEETVRSNELFAGVLAHDLRNPLSAIITAAQFVLMRHEGEGAQPGRDSKPLGRILASGQRMTRMIDQLLDFTRARTGGGIDVHPRPTNLAELANQALDELELGHPEWKIRRRVAGDPGGTWDPDRLLQVISNVVANAGQHGTPEPGISVELDGTDADRVVLAVHNQGSVPPALLPQLFDPFRSTRHLRGQSRGLGLGLFIVREIVRAHGGTVEVSSTEDAGTTFVIALPRHAPPRPGRSPG